MRKISQTMRRKHIDNFAKWREEMRRSGKWPSYGPLKESGDLAELIGVVLGDGSIHAFPRTECLRIVCNTQYPDWIKRCEMLIKNVFDKKPNIGKRKDSNCCNVTLYQKEISKRLGIHIGSQGNRSLSIPGWVLKNRQFVLRYLRGLYEAEGNLSIHEPTYTYKFMFTNRNDSLLEHVEFLWKQLGFHPHRSTHTVQISKKDEVFKASELIGFRKY